MSKQTPPDENVGNASANPGDPGVNVVKGTRQSVPAPGAEVVGTELAPVPGAQPGVVAEQPIIADSADDPNPGTHGDKTKLDPNAVKPGSADGPDLLGQATDPALFNPRQPLMADSGEAPSTAADAPKTASDDDASKQPVASRPTPQGPAAGHPHRRHR